MHNCHGNITIRDRVLDQSGEPGYETEERENRVQSATASDIQVTAGDFGILLILEDK